MKTSSRGRSFIKGFESLALRAYPDPGTGGKPWTIGYGSTRVWRNGRALGPVTRGLVINVETAARWFEWELLDFEAGVERLVRVGLTQSMFDALVSLAYNIGLDEDADTIAEGLGDSTLLRKLNALDYWGAADQYPLWNRAGGRVMRGLTRRRQGERGIFIEGLQ